MKTYPITITEKLQMDVEIEAENAAQAREIAERNWKNGDYSSGRRPFSGCDLYQPCTARSGAMTTFLFSDGELHKVEL